MTRDTLRRQTKLMDRDDSPRGPRAADRPLIVDIGVFAHDEASKIAAIVGELDRQDVFSAAGFDVRAVILANGCTDDTVERARAAAESAAARIEVVDLSQGGKSRTWNAFVHHLSRDGDVLVFCDADIEIPDASALRRLVTALVERPSLHVFNSRPIKDLAYRPEGLGALDRVIAAGGNTLHDWRSAICGQLYAMPVARARALHLPIGLPVEDGFLRAMILTDAMTTDEQSGRIDGVDDIFHVYGSERSIPALIRHQTRIVVGSAMNTALFAHLRSLPVGERRAELERAAADDSWLDRVCRGRLPEFPTGFVPLDFLTKRVRFLLREPRALLRPRRSMVLVAGFGFDFIVYLNAQLQMARGAGAGYW